MRIQLKMTCQPSCRISAVKARGVREGKGGERREREEDGGRREEGGKGGGRRRRRREEKVDRKKC